MLTQLHPSTFQENLAKLVIDSEFQYFKTPCQCEIQKMTITDSLSKHLRLTVNQRIAGPYQITEPLHVPSQDTSASSLKGLCYL